MRTHAAGWLRAVRAAGLLAVLYPAVAAGQVPLFLANEQTTVRDIAFTFTDTRTFDDERLLLQIATQQPTLIDRLRKLWPFTTARTYPLDRIELQKDVVRLRRFYQRNGFLEPVVDYGESQLDTTRNALRVVFTITEGPPLIIQDVNFFAPDGRYAASLFEGEARDRWIRFRDRTSFKTGDRYTDVDRIRIQDQVLTWLKDRGYAFARMETETTIDSTFYTADIRFELNPGPLGRFDDILVEGNHEVNKNVVLRELPFRKGDRFSNSKLIQGQQELFALNLFRVALADVPPADGAAEIDTLGLLAPTAPDEPITQPRDSTVLVRFRVREAKLRYVTAQTGYGREQGVTLQGQWIHRNFGGGARNLTVSLTGNSGLLASPSSNTIASRLLRGSVALRQPYLYTTRLSAIVEPFLQYERDPLLKDSDELNFLGLPMNRREAGVNSTLIFELLPFRNLSAQLRLSRALQADPRADLADGNGVRDAFSKSILSLNGTFGWVNNLLNPRRGYLIRPFAEYSGLIFTDVAYTKLGAEAVGYLPLINRIRLGVRLSGGRLWPKGNSRNQFDPTVEERFDPIRFYAGGANDVRGWANQLLGAKEPRPLIVNEDTLTYLYEPVGGLAKLAGNVELRMPFPGLSRAWRTALFVDFGQVSGERIAETDTSFTMRDTGRLRLRPSAFQYGVGGGVRYETPVGFIRLDLAFKVNPSELDLQNARARYRFEQGLAPPPRDRFLGRFNLHLSIGQAF